MHLGVGAALTEWFGNVGPVAPKKKCALVAGGGWAVLGKQPQWPKFEHFSHSALQGHLSWGLCCLNLFPGSPTSSSGSKFQTLAPPAPPQVLFATFWSRDPEWRVTFPATCPEAQPVHSGAAWPLSPPPAHFPFLSFVQNQHVSYGVNCTWHVLCLLHSFIAFIVDSHPNYECVFITTACLVPSKKWGCVLGTVSRVPTLPGRSRASSCPRCGSNGGHPCVSQAQAHCPDCVMVATWVCHFSFSSHLENQLHPGDARLCYSPETSKGCSRRTPPLSLPCPVSGLALIYSPPRQSGLPKCWLF